MARPCTFGMHRRSWLAKSGRVECSLAIRMVVDVTIVIPLRLLLIIPLLANTVNPSARVDVVIDGPV